MAPPDVLELHASPFVSEGLPPLRMTNARAGISNGSSKERKDPSVTPQKFRRFFTPRKLDSPDTSSATKALYQITRPGFSQKDVRSSPVRPSKGLSLLESGPPSSPSEHLTRERKRRRIEFSSPVAPRILFSPIHNPPSARVCQVEEQRLHSSPSKRFAQTLGEDVSKDISEGLQLFTKITPVASRGFAGQLLDRSIGSTSLGRRRHHVAIINDYRDHTASFYSQHDDTHACVGLEGEERTIPFCTAACNKSSLVAIGDEDGCVRLLETELEENSRFSDIFLGFRVHKNAIMDMNFSSDDLRLVTASGDQSARVVDMNTQSTISILGAHTGSLKQARFQPGSNSNNVIATSSRDGSIQIWDLRCTGYERPLVEISHSVDIERSPSATEKIQYGAVVNSIYDAHKTFSNHIQIPGMPESPSQGEPAGRIGDVSVTAIHFLSAELNHLLLSASEANSSIKLWDIRFHQTNRRRRNQLPLSSTAQPRSHNQWRHFGISSLSMSSDGTRLYTLCKDNTIYTYSTAHLMIGQAPHLQVSEQNRWGIPPKIGEGLEPLYGFRHPKFHASSFFVKSAVRAPTGGRCEMLAVGSSDGCAVLYPTDERYLGPNARERISLPPSRARGRKDDGIPISTCGTALIGGHSREVGPLVWTKDGALVTVGDDFLVRVWREGSAARKLRVDGEGEGRRWGCGWAEVDCKYDENDA
ncbi:BgtA-20230 [Blumeria graminis f. sp. tritici]|uniref:BgtA-20230 n=2 Tax=Blumeria graminis f. sp. tritici TaxID=62690 RepID=A0A9X9MPS3_BLUGR|nr:hypothetical protein BGT96224_A20230 [Blumeria graminis f. sp. tritici 96224]VDB94573.1 BgtA-20230 [Blumeria graminis f. sp. tritici]